LLLIFTIIYLEVIIHARPPIDLYPILFHFLNFQYNDVICAYLSKFHNFTLASQNHVYVFYVAQISIFANVAQLRLMK